MSKRGYVKKMGRSGKKLTQKKRAKLTGAKSSLKASKMAALRTLANSATAGFLGIETKFLDRDYGSTIPASVNAAGGEADPLTTLCLNAPAQGDNEQARDGKRIVVKNISVKGTVTVPVEFVSAEPIRVFVAMVLDTQTNGGQCDSELIFKNQHGSAATAVVPLRNLLYSKRFRVLKSQVFDLTSPAVGYGCQRSFEWFTPMELPVNFTAGDTGIVGNIVDNSIHMVAYATRTGAYLQYNSRARFQG